MLCHTIRKAQVSDPRVKMAPLYPFVIKFKFDVSAISFSLEECKICLLEQGINNTYNAAWGLEDAVYHRRFSEWL